MSKTEAYHPCDLPIRQHIEISKPHSSTGDANSFHSFYATEK